MDFELDEDLRDARDLAKSVFTDLSTVDRVREVESSHGGFDATLWQSLADTGLLSLALPEDVDGADLGLLSLCAVLEQQGRRVAPVPLAAVVATAAMPLAQFGSAEQKDKWLAGIADGSLLVTGGFEPGPLDPVPLRASRDGDGWRVTGEVSPVAGGAVADAVVVPVAIEGEEVVLAVVPADAPGLSVIALAVTDQNNSAALRFDGVALSEAGLLPGAGTDAVEWVRTRARVASAALALGVCEEALTMTASYVSEREQFGRPLSTNQAVSQRAADAYLDTEAIRLTVLRAATLIDGGDEAGGRVASLVAKWWAATGGLRVVHTGQHLHGGIGADVDYPIHRYFLWGRQLAFAGGTAGAVNSQLGELLAEAPAIGSA